MLSLFYELDGISRWVENPEYSEKVKELRLSSLKETRKAFEERLVEINKEIKDLEKSN